MKIGHINLKKEYGGSSHQLLMLVKALANHGIAQHAVVRNSTLARRLSKHSEISVGQKSVTRHSLSGEFLLGHAESVLLAAHPTCQPGHALAGYSTSSMATGLSRNR